jgi:4-hydroxy 2-oxovalerate aldolase
MRPKAPFKVFDCTLRDGGYYNNWDFPMEVVDRYLDSLTELDVFGVELGFRSNLKSTYRGPFANTTEATIDNLKLPDKFLYAVMLNVSELDDDLLGIKNQVNQLFIDSKKSRLDIVRIAAHYHEIPKAMVVGEQLKSKGYRVAFNLMGVNFAQSMELFGKINVSVIQEICEVFYLADSNGRLFPEQYSELVKLFNSSMGVPIGVHTHDNRGLAFSNSLAALSSGATWVDATVTGMGRGPGNTKLESIILELDSGVNKYPSRLGKLQSIIETYFSPEQKRLKWGTNLFYHLAAQQDIHPLRIQELLANTGINAEQLLDFLKPKIEGEELKLVKATETEKKKAINWLNLNLKDRPVLVIANNNSLLKHKYELNAFIDKYKPFVISVNGAGLEGISNIELIAAAYETRVSESFKIAKKFKLPFLSPFVITDTSESNINRITQIGYPLEISENKFQISNSKLILNGDETVPFVISVLLLVGANSIRLAGISGDLENSLIQSKLVSFFSKLITSYSNVDLISITPTTLPIRTHSLSDLI